MSELQEALKEAENLLGVGDQITMALFNAEARIREQRDLLDECEMLIGGLECRCDGMNRCARCVTLDKLRGQEKADENRGQS